MSNDHIFAAQMWSWTDPMIKRDSHGRILVVNAAFLQLYGGTIESWTGNPIEGWPTPRNPGEMSRFESRIPLPTGGETVYDWMECTHQDGTAVAMARDVTVYAVAQNAPAATPSQTATEEAAPAQFANAPAASPDSFANNQMVQEDLAALSPMAQTAELIPSEIIPEIVAEPVIETPAAPAQMAQQVMQAAPIAAAATAATAVAAMAQPTELAPAPAQIAAAPVEAPTTPVQAAPPVAAPQPVQAVADSAPVANVSAPDERAYEKRALPIENDDAILGNNWRDAVIAKAVGVEDDNLNDEASADAPPINAGANGEQIRVLLAEDNAINALLTRTLLEADGCLCDVVEDGLLAVEAVKNNEYDLVFMDMRMPNMDGLEATRKIRSMGYNAKVLPIVALTANAFDDDRNACFDSGMNDFMTKPVSAEELSAMVKTHTSLEAERIAS